MLSLLYLPNMATGRIIEHIDRLREKPEHVRHNIALGVAFGISGLVAVTWMTAMATSGTLALQSNTVDETPEGSEMSAAVVESTSAFSSLMGAAGAAFNATNTDAALKIIESETRTSSTLNTQSQSANASDKTVIPF